jgi:hypothetical protein
LRAAHRAVEAEASALRREIVRLDEQASGIRRIAAQHAYQLHFAQAERQRIYDRALLRKHPQRRLIAVLLDSEPRPLPEWVLLGIADTQSDVSTDESRTDELQATDNKTTQELHS